MGVVVLADQRVFGVAPVVKAERRLVGPLAQQVLELVLQAGAEEQAQQAARDGLRFGRAVIGRAVGHAAPHQGPQAALGQRVAARVHAADVGAKGATQAGRVVGEVEVLRLVAQRGACGLGDAIGQQQAAVGPAATQLGHHPGPVAAQRGGGLRDIGPKGPLVLGDLAEGAEAGIAEEGRSQRLIGQAPGVAGVVVGIAQQQLTGLVGLPAAAVQAADARVAQAVAVAEVHDLLVAVAQVGTVMHDARAAGQRVGAGQLHQPGPLLGQRGGVSGLKAQQQVGLVGCKTGLPVVGGVVTGITQAACGTRHRALAEGRRLGLERGQQARRQLQGLQAALAQPQVDAAGRGGLPVFAPAHIGASQQALLQQAAQPQPGARAIGHLQQGMPAVAGRAGIHRQALRAGVGLVEGQRPQRRIGGGWPWVGHGGQGSSRFSAAWMLATGACG